MRISTSVAFSASVSNVDKSIPASMKAWSVGAKTVNGPLPCSVETRPACVSASTRIPCSPVADALVGMSSVAPAETPSGNVEINRLAKIRVASALFMEGIFHNPFLKAC